MKDRNDKNTSKKKSFFFEDYVEPKTIVSNKKSLRISLSLLEKISERFSIVSKETFESIVFNCLVLNKLFRNAIISLFFFNISPFLKLFNSVINTFEGSILALIHKLKYQL